jgi:TRAP-type C4-dicarboxylate transport system substrate-binding protein
MIILNRVLSVLGMAILVSGGLAAPAAAADYTMKIAFGTANDIQHQWANWYKEEVEKRSNGRIEVKIFPRAVLGTGPSMTQGTQTGTIEAYTSPADFFAGIDPRFGVFAIPFMFKGQVHANRVINDPEMNKEILALGRDKGLHGVSVFTYSPSHYFAVPPIRSLDDFKGKKLRVNATPAERERMRLLGASAVPMDLAEVIPGIREGTIDGTMSGTAVYVNFKFMDLGKVITQTQDTMIVSIGFLSNVWLEKLPADLRQMVIRVGEEMQPRLAVRAKEIEDQMIERWKAAGGQVLVLPSAELQRLHKVLDPVGESVTRDNPVVSAFYHHMQAVGEKY